MKRQQRQQDQAGEDADRHSIRRPANAQGDLTVLVALSISDFGLLIDC